MKRLTSLPIADWQAMKDGTGSLPLHYAVEFGFPTSVVTAILSAYPVRTVPLPPLLLTSADPCGVFGSK